MTILQLHYTSCESGLSGHSGFQFCAMSAGVAQSVIREVEQLTAYEPPDHLQVATEAGVGEHPVNLIHTYSEHNGSTIIAQVLFTGLDFSHRSGNYFAHTLVIDAPEDDLRAVLPVELWAAPFWRSAQGPATELPPLPAPLPAGPITPELIMEFLAGTPEPVRQLESLLAAVDKAMDGGQRVLLVGADSAAVCHWIAAACYALGPVMGRQLTFATYSHDPRRCLTHVVGAIADDPSVRLDTAAFYTFELTTGDVPERVPSSPAAALLARAGLDGVAALWSTAASLSPLPGSLAESFPMLASAALILDQPLGKREAEAAIGWLAAPGNGVSAGQQGSAVRAVLRQARHELPVRRRRELVGMAVTADAAGAPGTDTLASEVECAFADDFFARLDHGLPPDPWTGYRTDRGRKAAADGCAHLLPSARPDVALGLLNWAQKARLRLPADVVRRTGHDVIMTAVLEDATPRGLSQTAPVWQALRLGMLDRLRQSARSGSAGRVRTSRPGHVPLGGPGSLSGTGGALDHRRGRPGSAQQRRGPDPGGGSASRSGSCPRARRLSAPAFVALDSLGPGGSGRDSRTPATRGTRCGVCPAVVRRHALRLPACRRGERVDDVREPAVPASGPVPGGARHVAGSPAGTGDQADQAGGRRPGKARLDHQPAAQNGRDAGQQVSGCSSTGSSRPCSCAMRRLIMR